MAGDLRKKEKQAELNMARLNAKVVWLRKPSRGLLTLQSTDPSRWEPLLQADAPHSVLLPLSKTRRTELRQLETVSGTHEVRVLRNARPLWYQSPAEQEDA